MGLLVELGTILNKGKVIAILALVAEIDPLFLGVLADEFLFAGGYAFLFHDRRIDIPGRLLLLLDHGLLSNWLNLIILFLQLLKQLDIDLLEVWIEEDHRLLLLLLGDHHSTAGVM